MLEVTAPETCQVIRLNGLSAATPRPLLGQWSPTDSGAWFHPTGRLLPQATYVVYSGDQVLGKYPPLEVPASTAQVTIYPQIAEIPVNLLKISLVFSEPMREGVAFAHLRWEDAQGQTLPLPFLELSPELWNHGNTQLTLWLDPGRIKRGLGPNEAQGTPLTEGEEYTLTVLSSWPTRQGATLTEDEQITWKVGSADRERPNPENWTVESPVSAHGVLTVDFQEPMAYAVLQDALLVRRQNEGEFIHLPGSFLISPDNQRLTFTPTEPWATGTYELLVYPRLEDLAGNNLYKLFDVDLAKDEVAEAIPWRTRFQVE